MCTEKEPKALQELVSEIEEEEKLKLYDDDMLPY